MEVLKQKKIIEKVLNDSKAKNIISININKKPRSKKKPSDHTPIELEIS